MINKINWISRIYQTGNKLSFKRNQNKIPNNSSPDTFEKRTDDIKKFKIIHKNYNNFERIETEVTQNPKDKVIVSKKVRYSSPDRVEIEPIELSVAKSKGDNGPTFHFLDEYNNEIGFVSICDWRIATLKSKDDTMLTQNYPELGIVGDRISIDYLQNNNNIIFSGIGKVADQIAIEYCLKEGITPNIVSMADIGSLISHYKRGRRFFKLEENTPRYRYFIREYGTNDPNKIIEERLAKTPPGSWAECEDLKELYMYMPQDIIQKYLQRIKEHPILH